MKKILLPILTLGILAGATWYLIKMRPAPEARSVVKKIPFVEVISAQIQPLHSRVRTHGTIRPRTKTTLIAEVPGIIEKVAPFGEEPDSKTSFRTGGFFRKGDYLLKIEDIDLRTMEAEAKANLSRVELQLIQERELAKQAKIEWGERDWNQASDLVKRIPQIRKAEAEKLAAETRLLQASEDLKRSEVRAPFEGRILKIMADIGQQVGAGASAALAEIYALESAEVDLALSRSEIDFLGFSDGINSEANFEVQAEILNSEGEVIHRGHLDRSEGVVDERTRLTNLVVRVDNCFANPFKKPPTPRPLTIGQFVNLTLIGKKVEVFRIPESAFRTRETILVVDHENQLHSRNVTVIHRSDKEAWITEGLNNGDQVCITPIEIISEGMKVQVVQNPLIDTNQTIQ